MATYLLLHGGAAGSWIWKFAADTLRKNGHEVHTVTFTGFAERRHLVARDSGIETHIADVLNAMEFGDIKDCTLVAHSYAGAVAPGVIAAAGDRISRVVYVDALVVKEGESVAEAMGFMPTAVARGTAAAVRSGIAPINSPVAEQQRAEAKDKPYKMTPERQEWMLGHLSNMPTISVVGAAPVGAESIKAPVEYVAVSDTVMKPMHERARKLGWKIHEVAGDHAILVGDPETLTRILQDVPR